MNPVIPENWQKIFAKNIIFERERLKISQTELAEKVGLGSGSAITTWEKMDGLPRFLAFIEMCRLFGREPTEMVCEDLSRKDTEPPDGKHRRLDTEGVLQETDVGAPDPPPPKGEEVKAMKRQMLEMMLKLEEMDAAH